MKSSLLILTLGSVAAYAQESTVIGTVNRLTAGEISVKTPRATFTISADERTELLKDKTYRGFSGLKIGDEISVRCEPNGSGKLVAIKIWANVVTFAAAVKYVNHDNVEV